MIIKDKLVSLIQSRLVDTIGREGEEYINIRTDKILSEEFSQKPANMLCLWPTHIVMTSDDIP